MLKEKRILKVLLVLTVAFMALPAIYAEDPGNYSSLNNSVQSTGTGGTLTLDRDYTYNNVTDSNFSSGGISVSKDMVIDGDGHTIDANRGTRAFTVSNNVNLILKNLIITNTVNTAIYLGTGSKLEIINCTFINNTGSTFSTIYMPNNSGDTLNLVNSTFINGSGQFAIQISKTGSATVTGCNFINNTGTGSTNGGIFNVISGTLTLNNSTFRSNTGNDGACIYNQGTGTSTITNCTFINNTALKQGAALRSSTGNLTVINCTFINNTASQYGGAIYNGGNTVIVGSAFINNTATVGGNAIYSTGTLNANKNWWGSNSPNFTNLIGNAAAPTTWIYMNLTVNVPAYLNSSDKIVVVSNFNYYTDGVNVTPSTDGIHVPDGLTIYSQTNNGQVTPSSTVNGLATTNYFYSGSEGQVNATVDVNPNSNFFTSEDFYQSVTFTVSRLIAGVTTNVTLGWAPLNVQFNGTSMLNGSVTYNWDFGDGTSSTEQNPTHTFLKSGIYTVKLTVTSKNINDTTSTIITVPVETPLSASYNTGNDTTQLNITLNGADEYYFTLNGTTPTRQSTKYTGPIILDAGLNTLKYLGIQYGLETQVYTEMFLVVITNYNGGIYNKTLNIALIGANEIYYTLNGDTPTRQSTKYTGPIKLNEGTTILKYFGIQNGLESQIYTSTYSIFIPLIINVNYIGGEYNSPLNITLTGADDIYYTLNGDIPTRQSTKYTGPITLDVGTNLLKFVGIQNGKASQLYIITYIVTLPVTVDASYHSGVYYSPLNVTLTGADDIYYTLNGSDPDSNSTKYTGPITINSGITVLKYMGIQNKIFSGIYTEKYNIGNRTQVAASLTNSEIQKIIDDAHDGDIIEFLGTSYSDLSLIINKPLTLFSKVQTVIASNFPVFTINNSNDGNIWIYGFLINVTGNDGIVIENSSNINILNTTVTANNGNGLLIQNSTDINITNLIVQDSNSGISIDNSTDVVITESNVSNNQQSGININQSENVSVTDSSIENNVGNGITLSNTRKTLISNDQINQNNNGVYFGPNTDNTTIKNSNINDNVGDGISFAESGSNTLVNNNTISGNSDGINLDSTSDNLVINQNIITKNSHAGVNVGENYKEAPTAKIDYNIIYGNFGRGEMENKYSKVSTSFGYNWLGANSWDKIFSCPSSKSKLIQLKIIQASSGEFQAVFMAGDEIAYLLPDVNVFFRLNNGIGESTIAKNGVAPFTYSSKQYIRGSTELEAFADNEEVVYNVTDDELDNLITYETFLSDSKNSLYHKFNVMVDYPDIESLKNQDVPNSGIVNNGITTDGSGGSSGGSSGSSSNVASSGSLAAGTSAAASTLASAAGSSSSPGQAKTVQELIRDNINQKSQFWGVIIIIVLLVVVIVAYYRKDIMSMIKKSKK
ncbi:FN3 associated domain-containing protein [uncultured Methanobacterium sp.]|uniref:FN3 associated domain-containing protein n=1 Tax=uncultured Methanobacterium sp. TaxID=176306 RepID=UPI002AA667CF|nr:FN3 associated domain-containing protein [uncultured Methanobacterium sp.]